MNRKEFFTATAKCILPSITLLGLGTILNGFGSNVARAASSCDGCSGKCTKTCASDCSGGSYWTVD